MMGWGAKAEARATREEGEREVKWTVELGGERVSMCCRRERGGSGREEELARGREESEGRKGKRERGTNCVFELEKDRDEEGDKI